MTYGEGVLSVGENVNSHVPLDAIVERLSKGGKPKVFDSSAAVHGLPNETVTRC